MIGLLLAALLQGTAPVSSMVAANAPEPVAEKPDKDGIVCRKETVLGSRLARKVCFRPSDVQARAQDDRDMLSRAQVLQTIRDPAAGPPP
ncbi:MAG: hypothetical protein ACOY5Y_14545 [Pseudomonadota bacterium]|jgi:hypothetical protein